MSDRSTGNHRALRQEALKFYGGSCVKCGQTDFLQLWLVPLAGTTWADIAGVEAPPSTRDKYKWLKDHYWPRKVEIQCSSCYKPDPGRTSELSKQAAVKRRSAEHLLLIEHYGGKCSWCPNKDPQTLEVATLVDTSWIGILGPHPKYKRERKLIAAGLPAGVRLLCNPRCH